MKVYRGHIIPWAVPAQGHLRMPKGIRRWNVLLILGHPSRVAEAVAFAARRSRAAVIATVDGGSLRAAHSRVRGLSPGDPLGVSGDFWHSLALRRRLREK